jgi:signal transduction histidine kinase/CheY-like chemotaxis protein
MKRLFIIVYSVFVIIMLVNYFYYKSLYNKQVNYIFELLDRQVQIVGLSVDETNYSFVSDLNQINFTQNPAEDLTQFFLNEDNFKRTTDKMKLFYSKYEDFVTGIRFFDNNRNEYTLKRDLESDYPEWLEEPWPGYKVHVQAEILKPDQLIRENREFNYYLPVIDKKTDQVVGNIVVTVDFQKYFTEIFSLFNIEDYQWQWVLSDSGEVVYNNFAGEIRYSQLDRITRSLAEGAVENITHSAVINGKKTEVISSYYSTQLLQQNFGLVFSAPTAFFQKYIIRNSLFIVVGTLMLIQVIIFLFWRYLKSQKAEKEGLKASENMLFRMIDEMPVGLLIHNKDREIIKANKVAAEQYSYNDESEMQGRIFPEAALPENESSLPQQEGSIDPSQFIVIKKEIGEVVLYRKSIPVTFNGTDCALEILIDVTMLESARKHEAKANVAKSEFLARMSYEIRTPLNGIIGMTDVLNRYDLSPEVKDIVRLLRRSTELLLNIVSDILDFSKIESGKMILDEVPFNLREEITYCTDLAKTNISLNKVELISIVDDNVPENIIGDPFRLRQVITNLLNHSIRNTENGEIKLRCSLKSRKDGVLTIGFEMQDTGMSFDKSAFKKIFGDFVNMETRVLRNNDESSFGPILARQLVELMGGEISAESPSEISGDSGSKISFTISAYSNERTEKKVPIENVSSFDKIKALAISGSQNRDEEVLSSLHKMGISLNITTFTKLTVNQVKANLNYTDEKYNLIIIFDDKEFDGFNAARTICESKLCKEFIMIMISSNDRKGNYNNCITMGIDHYMIKPFVKAELISVIKSCFPFVEEKSDTEESNLREDIRILVVEDNKMNQKVMGTMLRNIGYSYDIADDGYAGFLQARAKKYDLIFMDLVMPELDGFESAQRILKNDKSVIIVAFTADNMPETRKKAELAGIVDFISKPVRIDDLKKLITKHFK